LVLQHKPLGIARQLITALAIHPDQIIKAYIQVSLTLSGARKPLRPSRSQRAARLLLPVYYWALNRQQWFQPNQYFLTLTKKSHKRESTTHTLLLEAFSHCRLAIQMALRLTGD
jgi:hypothetical protein